MSSNNKGTGSKGGGKGSNSGGGGGRPSKNSITKPYGGYYQFGASYCLKPGDEEEIDAIITAFQDADEEQARETRRGK